MTGRKAPDVPRQAAELARALRAPRATPSGRKRRRPWRDVAAEVARAGLGRFTGAALERAVARLLGGERYPPLPTPAELEEIDAGWRRGWALEYPGEPWPGLEEAMRRLTANLLDGPSVEQILAKARWRLSKGGQA